MNPEAYKKPYTMTKWDLSQEYMLASIYESNNIPQKGTKVKSSSQWTEKAFDKIQQSTVVKTLRNTGIEGESPQLLIMCLLM